VLAAALSATVCSACTSAEAPDASATHSVQPNRTGGASTEPRSTTSDSAPSSSPTSTRPKPVPRNVVKRSGISIPIQRLDGFIKSTGSTPAQLSIYQHWAGGALFDQAAGLAALRRGMSIAVTWEPWDPACNCTNQPAWSDRKIAAGAHDTYIKAYARSVRAFAAAGGAPVTVRLAHEMNGNWYPWGVGVNGNTAADYIAMWRHVHNIFAREGVTNVRWMWAPNLNYEGATSMGATYPGRTYVDRVGLSGYNFGSGKFSSWRSFEDLYQPSLDILRSIAPHKQLYIAEIACASNGGDKAAWIKDMFAQIKKRRYIAGFVWFDQSPAARDWLIENDPANVAVWRAGMAALPRP
jgi:hypothetical protein